VIPLVDRAAAESLLSDAGSPMTLDAGHMVMYFAQSDCGPVKIGVSKMPEVRAYQVAKQYPVFGDLHLRFGIVGCSRIAESVVMSRLRASRYFREWFLPTDQLLQLMLVLEQASTVGSVQDIVSEDIVASEDKRMSMGRRVQAIREHNNLTIAGLHRLMIVADPDEAPSHQWLRRLEADETPNPGIMGLSLVARVLGVGVEELTGL